LAVQAASADNARWDAVRNAPDYDFQLALLEIENNRLRDEAKLLLERQALLEELAEKKGVKIKGFSE
jgi:hypothetical protein